MSAKANHQDWRRPLEALAVAVLAVALSLSYLRIVARADDASASDTVTIDYDSNTDIHSVTDSDEDRPVLHEQPTPLAALHVIDSECPKLHAWLPHTRHVTVAGEVRGVHGEASRHPVRGLSLQWPAPV